MKSVISHFWQGVTNKSNESQRTRHRKPRPKAPFVLNQMVLGSIKGLKVNETYRFTKNANEHIVKSICIVKHMHKKRVFNTMIGSDHTMVTRIK